jgi:hypothetical protein
LVAGAVEAEGAGADTDADGVCVVAAVCAGACVCVAEELLPFLLTGGFLVPGADAEDVEELLLTDGLLVFDEELLLVDGLLGRPPLFSNRSRNS